jgi:hypothetical protein
MEMDKDETFDNLKMWCYVVNFNIW